MKKKAPKTQACVKEIMKHEVQELKEEEIGTNSSTSLTTSPLQEDYKKFFLQTLD
jgi:hypothetical protein